MEKSLEQKFDALIKQFRTQQIDGPQKSTIKLELTPEKTIQLFEELLNENKQLHHSENELYFAYQTMEIGYQRYWEFFNFAPDGYLVTDTDGIIREANETILSMLATKPTDLLDKSIVSLMPEIKNNDFGLQLNWFSGSQNLELMLQPRNRGAFYASVSIAPQRNLLNKPIGLLWLVRDITERKKTEEDLRKSRAELSLILEQTPYVLWTTDINLNLISVSGANQFTSEHTSTSITVPSITEYFGAENGEIILKAHQNAISGTTQTLDFERHGQIFQSTIEPLRDKNEQITGVIGAAFNITDLKRAEKSLQESEKFNSNLLVNSPNPIIVINSDTSIAYVNPAFEKLAGFPSQMAIGQKAPYPWWTEDNEQAMVRLLTKLKKKKSKQEQLFRRRNGNLFWAEVTTTLIENEDRPIYHLQTWGISVKQRNLEKTWNFM